ncbi:MAG: GerMN domain-containing protein [Eubacteriales bacterium]|nr:GerMN domain-containing protein [Eubacteriales bacterium]
MNRKGYVLLVLCLIMVVLAMMLSGCGDNEEPNGDVITTIPVKLYYVNEEYVTTGDETFPELLMVESALQISENENTYLALMDALREAPGEGMSTIITGDINFLDIAVSKEDPEMIVVDLDSNGLSGGSLGEGLFIKQVVDTLLENGIMSKSDLNEKEIKKVQFLVDGQVVESLMGHIDAREPFTRQ